MHGTSASQQAVENPFRHSTASMTCTSGTRGEHPRSMLKKATQQGRSKRRGDAYFVRYGEASERSENGAWEKVRLGGLVGRVKRPTFSASC